LSQSAEIGRESCAYDARDLFAEASPF
jgi:hypothetical protein